MYTETLLLTTHFQFKLMEHLTWWGLLIISTHFSSQSVGRWKIFDLIWPNFGVPWWGIWPKILLKSQKPQICPGSPFGSTLLLILLVQHICLGLAIMIAFISKCYETPLKLLYLLIIYSINIIMLFAGWEVRMVKNCDRGLEAWGHSFLPYGTTLSRQITCLFFSCSQLVLQLITNGFVYASWIGLCAVY